MLWLAGNRRSGTIVRGMPAARSVAVVGGQSSLRYNSCSGSQSWQALWLAGNRRSGTIPPGVADDELSLWLCGQSSLRYNRSPATYSPCRLAVVARAIVAQVQLGRLDPPATPRSTPRPRRLPGNASRNPPRGSRGAVASPDPMSPRCPRDARASRARTRTSSSCLPREHAGYGSPGTSCRTPTRRGFAGWASNRVPCCLRTRPSTARRWPEVGSGSRSCRS